MISKTLSFFVGQGVSLFLKMGPDFSALPLLKKSEQRSPNVKKQCFLGLLLLACLASPAKADDFWLDYACLSESYPGIVKGVSADSDGKRWILVNGKTILYDARKPEQVSSGNAGHNTGNAAGVEQQGDLDNADLKRSMAQVYPLEAGRAAPQPGFNPGRARSYDFLGEVYGRERKNVEAGLVAISLGIGKKIRMSGAAGLPQAFAAINAQLTGLLATRADIKAYVLPISGGYVYRKISGEQRLSPHAFGIAVDLNSKKGLYWKWAGGDPHKARAEYPQELVSVFEEHGFIWGGKWHEYDLMHFEYRPELICKAKKLMAATDKPDATK